MDGIIIINKEKGWTSNDIVQKLKGTFHEKVGHTGTLDPLATGVLPILIGKGTLLSKYLINHDKQYIAKIKLGQKTSTADSEGEIIEQKQVTSQMLDTENVKNCLLKFKGKQSQIPPLYSAIKVNGKKLYEYARKGQNIEIKPRKIEIYSMELIEISTENNEITYKVNCSKGTYIRTLCENIAESLGTVGYMKDLQRIKVGDFDIQQSLKISDIVQNPTIVKDNFITIEKFFDSCDKIILNPKKLRLFLNGVKLEYLLDDGIYRVYDDNGIFIGIAECVDSKIKRDIIVTTK